MSVASSKRGGRRPKAPDVEFSGAGAKGSVADGAVASSPSPEVVVDDVDRSFSRDTSQDTEPVSISDLEAVFQPGHAPPLWAGSSDPAAPVLAPASDRDVSSSASPRSSESAAASLRRMEELVGGALPAENPSSARSILAPVLLAVSRTSDAPPVSSQPLSDRELLFEPDKPDTAPPPAMKKRKPSFFDVDDALSPRAHLFDAAPAPFDPHVPALPGRLNLDDDDENNPDSGLLDIRRLAARESENKKKKKNAARADEAIFNLTGGLFAGGASAPLVAPDLNALLAPVVSEPSRPSAPSRGKAAAGKPAERASSAPVAAILARQPTLATPAPPQRGARAGLLAAIALLGVGLALAAFKLGSSSPTGATAETATPTSAAETAKPALPIATTPPAVSPEPTVTARDPGALAKPEKDPVAATAAIAATAAAPATSTPRATAAPSPAGVGAAPVVAAPAGGAPVVAAPPPPPAAAEFSKSAAIAALAAAAGRAAGCKQADGPSGGATVSITFAPSGRVTSSKVTGPPFQGTPVGGCIASAFRSASVPPFEGSPVTVTKNVALR